MGAPHTAGALAKCLRPPPLRPIPRPWVDRASSGSRARRSKRRARRAGVCRVVSSLRSGVPEAHPDRASRSNAPRSARIVKNSSVPNSADSESVTAWMTVSRVT